jgi:hypothetical protein
MNNRNFGLAGLRVFFFVLAFAGLPGLFCQAQSKQSELVGKWLIFDPEDPDEFKGWMEFSENQMTHWDEASFRYRLDNKSIMVIYEDTDNQEL